MRILWGVFLFVSVFCHAQDYEFGHLTTLEGLSHNEVRKIIKDTDGFLWLGTQNGLNRYDGYRFKIFKNVPNDQSTIVNNCIYDMAVSKNKLWLATLSGISILNTKTLQVITPESLSQAVGDKQVFNVFFDGNKTVWLSTKDDNFTIDINTYKLEKVLKGYKVACLGRGINNKLWIGTDKGLLYYNNINKTILHNYNFGPFNAYSLDHIYTNEFGEVWATQANSLYRFQSVRNRFVKVHESNVLNTIDEDASGQLFIGSYGGGLIRYNRSSGLFSANRANALELNSLSSDDVYDVFIDEENILWVGTQEGLDYYDFTRHKFKSLIHVPNEPNSLSSSFVQSISQGIQGDILVGMRSGIDQITFNNAYQGFTVSRFKQEKITTNFDGLLISCLYWDSKQRLWIGTEGQGCFLYDKTTQSATQFKNTSIGKPSTHFNSVNAIIEDHLGNIWLGTNTGVCKLKKQNNSYTFEHIRQIPDTFNLSAVYALLEDHKNRIWLATNGGGVFLINNTESSSGLLQFKQDPEKQHSLSSDRVFVAFQDSKNRIWFGTTGGGLNLLEENNTKKQSFKFKRYTEAEGLADNEVNAILEDNSGVLWISTNKGLSKLNPETAIFYNYSQYDGVLKGKFRKNSCWKDANGTLFFGGVSGINYFNPDSLKISKTLPKPAFTAIEIDEKEVTSQQELDGHIIFTNSLESGTQITLPYGYNRFDLFFTALSYTSPIRNQYTYKLEGVDQEWKEVSGKNPKAAYSNLPAGTFRFYLKAANSDGAWSSEPIYLDVIVKHSFWEGKKVKIIVALLIGMLLVFAFLLVQKKRRNKLFDKAYAKKQKNSKPISEEANQENLLKAKQLQQLMEVEQLYLNTELSLNDLADKLEVSPNYISMLLNDYVGKSFYDYVNAFRVDEVKKRLLDPAYSNQTLSAIGGDCGFNTKSTFNRIFKNFTGKTPSQFQKEQLK